MKLCLFLLFILPWSTVAADKEKVVQDRDNSIVVTSDEIQPSFDGSNVDDDNTKNAATARFFSNGFLEGLSQLILVQGQISSCYSCTSTFPRHSSTCCNQGFSNCCADSEYSKDSSKKPGYCPSIGSGTLNQKTCSHQCHYDADCPADYKCCPYGCSYLCAKSKPAASSEKPGFCPPIYDESYRSSSSAAGGFGYHVYPSGSSWTFRDDIKVTCWSDFDCPGSQKCCPRQYERVCVSTSYSYSYGR